ncbi:TPA_asm: P overlapped [Ocimum alphacytorhabdovirus 1]|nr:TPA_asm: P overlapped [Ocimum alphacytorhabdovirus 1]
MLFCPEYIQVILSVANYSWDLCFRIFLTIWHSTHLTMNEKITLISVMFIAALTLPQFVMTILVMTPFRVLKFLWCRLRCLQTKKSQKAKRRQK